MEELICRVCGKEFTTTRKKQKHCSKECGAIGRRRDFENSIVRIDEFIDKLPDMNILDVLDGRISHGTLDNRVFLNVKGVRGFESPNVKYYVVVVEEE